MEVEGEGGGGRVRRANHPPATLAMVEVLALAQRCNSGPSTKFQFPSVFIKENIVDTIVNPHYA